MRSGKVPFIIIFIASILIHAGCVQGKGPANLARPANEETFGIYTSTLEGKDMKLTISDPYREINHARVSPDMKWITFTRYNKKGFLSKHAKEINGYDETEIMIVRPDGTGLESIVPARKNTVAANGYWTPDGKGIIYVSTDNSSRTAQINHIDLATRKVTRIPTPKDRLVGDPHQVGEEIVFNMFDKENKKFVLGYMEIDGSKFRQITDPRFPEPSRGTPPPLGDYDAKISPDGDRIAIMRHVDKAEYHVVMFDTKSGEEKDLSAPGTFDGVPEWSSDGKLLIYWHADLKQIHRSGLWVMKPDGRERKQIPLPRGYLYTMPAFYPKDGSGPNTRIIFSAEKAPQLK
jgi:Tol biopolymer transport system component